MGSKCDLQCAYDIVREAVEGTGVTVEDADSNYNTEFVFTMNGRRYGVTVQEIDDEC